VEYFGRCFRAVALDHRAAYDLLPEFGILRAYRLRVNYGWFYDSSAHLKSVAIQLPERRTDFARRDKNQFPIEQDLAKCRPVV